MYLFESLMYVNRFPLIHNLYDLYLNFMQTSYDNEKSTKNNETITHKNNTFQCSYFLTSISAAMKIKIKQHFNVYINDEYMYV